MTDYTPTTEVVRDAATFPRRRIGEPRDMTSAEFNRWLANEKAKAIEEAAMNIDFDFEVFTADDGFPSIRQHGKSPSELLMEFAKSIREEAQ